MNPDPSAPPSPPQAPIPQAQGPPAETPEEIPSTPEERQSAMFCHLGGILPGFGWAVPLVLMNQHKDSRFIDDQGREACNFLINAALIFVISLITIPLYIGLILCPAVVIGTIIMCVMAGQAAGQGKMYRYPFNARYF